MFSSSRNLRQSLSTIWVIIFILSPVLSTIAGGAVPALRWLIPAVPLAAAVLSWSAFQDSQKWIGIVGLVLLLPMMILASERVAGVTDIEHRATPFTYEEWRPADDMFFLGTDGKGRDRVASIVLATGNTYLVSLVATFVAILLGTAIGLAAGSRAWFLRLIGKSMCEVSESIPQILWLILVMGLLSSPLTEPSVRAGQATIVLPLIGLLVAFACYPTVGRFVQRRLETFRDEPFVRALHSCGLSHREIMWRCIVGRRLIGQLPIQVSVLFGRVLILESSLSYLYDIGFVGPGTIRYHSLGALLSQVRGQVLFPDSYPGARTDVALVITVIVVSIVGAVLLGGSLLRTRDLHGRDQS